MQDYKTNDDLNARPRRPRQESYASARSLAASVLALIFAITGWLFIAAIAIAVIPANGADISTSRLWVTPGAVSYHLNRSKNYNEVNTGFGVEYRASEDFSLALGQYKNSVDLTSWYALVGYTPFRLSDTVRAGVLFGAVNGYHANNGRFLPALIPVIAIEFRHVGANISFVPPFKDKTEGAIALQLKFRF